MFGRSHIIQVLTVGAIMLAVGDARSQEPKTFDRIFGSGPEYNGMALILDDRYTLKHDTTNCSVQRVDQHGKASWTTDLGDYGCELLYFGKLSEGKFKGCDVLIQFMDKRIYGIRSKTGQLKLLKPEDIERATSRPRSRATE